MENQEQMSPTESLEIISRMIREAQVNVRKNSFYYLLWGWVIAAADLGVYILIHVGYPRPFLVWLIIIPAWMVTIIRGFSNRRSEHKASHLNRVNSLMWMAFGITMFVVILFGQKINFQINPIILLTTAIPTFVSGVILRFRPLMIGALVFLAGSIGCFLLETDTQFLLSAVTVICGFLIPGYMIKRLPENV